MSVAGTASPRSSYLSFTRSPLRHETQGGRRKPGHKLDLHPKMALFVAFHAALAATGRATYDEGAAHMFYKLSTASYCSSADLAAWDCPPCAATKLKAASAPKTFYDKATGARGYVGAFTGANSSDMLVLAFEGSENVENWIENLKIAKTEYAAPPVEPWLLRPTRPQRLTRAPLVAPQPEHVVRRMQGALGLLRLLEEYLGADARGAGHAAREPAGGQGVRDGPLARRRDRDARGVCVASGSLSNPLTTGSREVKKGEEAGPWVRGGFQQLVTVPHV